MLTIMLNIMGAICITVSIFYIMRINKKEKDIYSEIMVIYKDVKYYYKAIENTLKGFDDLIESSLNKFEGFQHFYYNHNEIDEMEKSTPQEEDLNIMYESNVLENVSHSVTPNRELYEKVTELRSIGLSNKEIAKKLNKGVREIDIIIKMWGNLYKDYNHKKID